MRFVLLEKEKISLTENNNMVLITRNSNKI